MVEEMEQFSMFAEPEKDAYLKIKPVSLDILQENGLSENCTLNGEMTKSYYSVSFLFDKKDSITGKPVLSKKTVFRIYKRIRINSYIAVPEYTLLRSDFMNQSSGTTGKDPVYIKFNLPNLAEIEIYRDVLVHVFHEVLDTIPREFDCCSRVEACSDELKCIHPDKKLAFRCGYRRILKSGRCFYGKNRNVE